MKNTTLKITVLEPSQSDNWLTNGETFSQKVYLAPNDNADNWKEITYAEKEMMEKELFEQHEKDLIKGE